MLWGLNTARRAPWLCASQIEFEAEFKVIKNDSNEYVAAYMGKRALPLRG
jgi:hypothetical protein